MKSVAVATGWYARLRRAGGDSVHFGIARQKRAYRTNRLKLQITTAFE